jgi:hypothetical protein
MSPSSYGLRTPSGSRLSRFSPLPFIPVVAFALILLLLFSKNAYSADVTLAWHPNSEEDLAGYRIFYREAGQNYNYNAPLWEGSETTWTVYNLDDMTTHCFVVRAFDISGNESGDSNEVCYQPSLSLAPAADAGPDQTVDEGLTVTLDGSNSTDADGMIASSLWTQKTGTSVTLSDAASAQPTFTAPYVGLTGEALTFQLTVTDNGGLADTDTVIINVSNVNQAPTADAGPDQTVDEADTVTLDGSNSSDPDDIVESYLWTQTHGKPVTLSNPRAIRPTFTGPFVGGVSEALNFQLTVNDQGGLSDADSVTVSVHPSPRVPVQTIFDLEAKTGARGVRLRWSPLPDASCYHVYRGLASGGPYTKIADCYVTDRCTYPDTDLMIGVTYYYVVTSVIGGVESLDSNRVSATLKRGKR